MKNSTKIRSNVLIVAGGLCILFLTVAVLYWAQADRRYESPLQDDADVMAEVDYDAEGSVVAESGIMHEGMQMGEMEEDDQVKETMSEKYAKELKSISDGGRFLKKLRKVREKPSIEPKADNPLYVDLGEKAKSIDTMIDFINEFFVVGALQHDRDLVASYTVLNKYRPLLGITGILEAMAVAEISGVKYSTYSLHKMGEYAETQRIETSATYTQLVDVVNRDILHHAPLHGAVWTAIRSVFGNQDPFTLDSNELQDYVDRELCYFEDYPDMENNWISCIHGVGHALGQLFGADHSADAAKVCYRDEKPQWSYNCATGIFMNEMQPGEHAHMDDSASYSYELTKSEWYPCDQSPMAASCYRFKNILLNKLNYFEKKRNTQFDLCAVHPDRYHQMGCAWAFAYTGKNIFDTPDGLSEKFNALCDRFHPSNPTYGTDPEYRIDLYMSCMDGAFRTTKRKLRKQDENFCRQYDSISAKLTTLCEAIRQNVGQVAHDFWNTELLEKYYGDAQFERTQITILDLVYDEDLPKIQYSSSSSEE